MHDKAEWLVMHEWFDFSPQPTCKPLYGYHRHGGGGKQISPLFGGQKATLLRIHKEIMILTLLIIIWNNILITFCTLSSAFYSRHKYPAPPPPPPPPPEMSEFLGE